MDSKRFHEALETLQALDENQTQVTLEIHYPNYYLRSESSPTPNFYRYIN